MIVTQDTVNNSIFSLHLGRGMVSSVRMVSSVTQVTKGKPYDSRVSDYAIVHLGLNVNSFAHNCGCVVDGGNAMAVI